VGAGAAVVRAAMMSGVLVIGTALKRQSYVPASLAFVALLMSAHNPRVLWSVSFQLSFFATLGLALFATPFSRGFESLLTALFNRPVAQTLSRLLSESLVVSLAALATTIPLTVLYFNRLSLVQLPVNLLIVPVQPLVLFGGILATLVSLISPAIAQPIYWFTMMLLQWTVSVVRSFAALPFADVAFYADATLIQVFFVVIIGGAILQATQPAWAVNILRLAQSRAVFSTISAIGAVMFALGVATYTARPDGQLHVHMLDVGHSSGFLVETPGGAQILVDGGRFPSRLLTQIGDRMPFNDRHIEVVVITQPDEFTYGAVPALLERYSAGVVLTNGQPNDSDAYAELQNTIAPYPTVDVVAGYRVELSDGTKLEVLAPTFTPALADSIDDNTLLLRLSYGDISFLLTSDLSATGQSDFLDADGYPLATVMQLPQHATARSLNTAFLEQTQAQLYLLHNDRANRRGDPNPDTLTLLNPDIPLYRTDDHGSVHIWTDGQGLWVLPETR
jgi:competence protein ComEC